MNTKGSALLTHGSIMIAVSAVFFSANQQQGGRLRVLFGLDIVAYLVATVLALFAVQITSPRTFAGLTRQDAYA